jgi:poly(A) polymerase
MSTCVASGNSLDRLTPIQHEVTQSLAGAFGAANEELYLVGGIVRDVLLGRAMLADLDFATSAAPPRTRELLESAGATSVYLIGERFGTIGAIFDDDPDRLRVEVTTYRRETYPDEHRFPDVAFDATLIDDLARRDFTMNALAIDARSGEMIDPWDGEADIAQSLLRAVGNPSERFAEDPLRLLRAARFVSQLGFRLDWRTEQAMAHQATSLARISRERILAELTLLMLGEYVDHGLEALRRTRLLHVALPRSSRLRLRRRQTSRHGSVVRKTSGTIPCRSYARPHPAPRCAGRPSCTTPANR